MTEIMGMGDHGETTPFEPPYEAHRLRLSGMAWREVARRTGYLNETACRIAVKNYISRAADDMSRERRAEALMLQMDRLDELLHAYWQPALIGDDKAAQIVLRVIAQQGKYQKLEEPEKSDDAGVKTVLVMGGSDKYVQELKQIVTNAERAKQERLGRAVEQSIEDQSEE